LVRRLIATLCPGLRDVDYEAVERGRAFLLESRRHGQCSLVGGLFLLREGKRDWMASWEADLPVANWPQLSSPSPVQLPIPGEIRLQGGWTLNAKAPIEAISIRDQCMNNTDPFQAWIDAQALPSALSVRGRQAGDRLKPLGMLGHSLKVSDLMVNAKIPRRLRPAWPLVCASDEILWVPGCRQGDSFRVSPETQHVVYLRLSKDRPENG
jgi:tRNA(Ile)-lysidine synthetase-like protein